MLRGRTFESVKVGEMYESKKIKRYRSAFTTNQINYLEKQFKRCPYIGSAMRKDVADLLNISERAIKIWFQNRRMKEKKELNNKECIDRHNLMNNTDIAKDSLNNVHSLQSTNDRQCSLQPTVAKHVDKTNCTSYCDATLSNQNKNLKNEIIDNRKLNKFKSRSLMNQMKGVERASLLDPGNSVGHHLNKHYNNKNFVNYLEMNKNRVAKCKGIPKTTPKSANFKHTLLNATPTLTQYDSPEDLSARNLSNVMLPQNHNGNIHLSSAYIPYCNPRDVCVSAGNLIWKPVNVMPTSKMVPSIIPDRQSNINRNKVQKCQCNCNCNSKNVFNYEQGNVETQPRYVIAIPYNSSNLNILR